MKASGARPGQRDRKWLSEWLRIFLREKPGLKFLESDPPHPVKLEGFPLTFDGSGTGPKHE